MSIISTTFKICSTLLQLTSKLTGLTYQSISVIVNLYIQGALLTISGCLPLLSSTIQCVTNFTIARLLMTLLFAAYASFYIVFFILMLRRYHKPMEYAFDKCVDDLYRLADHKLNGYYLWNVLIFIVWWMALIAINLVLTMISCPNNFVL